MSSHDLNVAVVFSSLPLCYVSSGLHFFYTLVVDARARRSPVICAPIVLVSLTALIAEKLDDPYKIKDDVKLAVEVDGDFDWETMLSVTSKGAESQFAALVAGKQGTAAAGGREGSQGGTNRWSKHKSN